LKTETGYPQEFPCIFIPSILTSFPIPADEKHGILGVMIGVGFAPDSVLLDGKKAKF
jgi:hypothetical protein